MRSSKVHLNSAGHSEVVVKSLIVLDCKRAEMSNDIYDDVIRTESEGMNRKSVVMTVDIYESADCVRDHDFRTETNTHQPPQQMGSDSANIRSSRAATVCLVLLCVLLLTAVIALCVHIHTNNTNYTQETHQLLTKITNLTEEKDKLLAKINNHKDKRDELLIKITNLSEQRDQLLTRNTNLTEKRDELLTKNMNLRDAFFKSFKEIDGWLYSSFSFYFISTLKQSWTESRRYCTERGADLIIINNKEEQEFAKKFSHGNEVWIGLTDSDVEGTWKWVDDSTLISGFWASGQPNVHKKNCVVTYSKGWADKTCNKAFKWICEKSIAKYHIQ
ncbi:uncharacterized protein [Garra rufa]|uniref:uncharacterized protein n=1 Tax=Garra rufa TaxID=137080 RepID=UPI003CCED282